MKRLGRIVVFDVVLGTWCSYFGFDGMLGCDDFGWLGGCCCYGGIEMKIGCCCDEKKSCSTFGFDCFLAHYPSTLDVDYHLDGNCFDLEKGRVDGCCNSHWLPQGHVPLEFDGIGRCNVWC